MFVWQEYCLTRLTDLRRKWDAGLTDITHTRGMLRTLTLSIGLLLCSASARSLSQAELQQVAQEMLALPQDDRTVQQARPFALTWLGDAAGVESEGMNAGGDASMLARLAIRAGHPELLPIFLKSTTKPQSVIMWSAVLDGLIASGQFEQADRTLRLADPQNRVNLLAQMGISVTGRDPNFTDEQRRWAVKWLGEISNADLQKLAPAEQSRVRGLLAASYVRLGDLSSATQIMQAEPLFVKNQLWHQMAFESVMARQAERAKALTAMIKPVNATEQRMLAGLLAEQATSLNDLPQLRKVLETLRTTQGKTMSAREVDATVLGMVMHKGQSGHFPLALGLLGQLSDQKARILAQANLSVTAARQGNPDLAKRLAIQANYGLNRLKPPSADLVWDTVEALGAAGMTREGDALIARYAWIGGALKGRMVRGLVGGNWLDEAQTRAAQLRQPQDLFAAMQGVLILTQRQRTADVREFLTLLRPAMQAQQGGKGNPGSARSMYLRLLAKYGGDQVLAEVRPSDELGNIRFAAAESGNLEVIEALLKPGEGFQEIETGAAALALAQNGYADEAMALFRKMNAPDVKALIGVSLLQGEARPRP